MAIKTNELPTNQEFLIACLNGEVDDGGASWEAELHYHIACPYFNGDERALCNDSEEMSRDLCVECKRKWLESPIDE